MFVYLSQKTFNCMVRIIKYCPVTIEEVCNTNTIFGCNGPTIKGKTILQQPNRVQAVYIEVPDSLRERVGNMTVAADVMFEKIIPFVVSLLRVVNFTTLEYFSQRLKTALANSIGQIFQFYKNNGYTIKRS